jgi:two-component system nitrate/nitrite response regulator NarL
VQPIRLLLVDDHGLVLQAIRLALEPHPEIEIVGEATSGSEVLPRVAETRPNLVLLDIRMPGLDGLQVLDRLHERYPELKVVMLSAIEDRQIAAEALERGATAFLGKGIDPADVAPILHRIVRGERVTESLGTEASFGERVAADLGLSSREREILEFVAAGRSNNQIAGELWLSEQTIKYHLTNIYRKLDVSRRTEAARFAYDHGLAGGTSRASNGTNHTSA